jgi:hypothetical protein
MGLRLGVDSEQPPRPRSGSRGGGEARRKERGEERRGMGLRLRCGFRSSLHAPRSGSEAVGRAKRKERGRREEAWGFA